MTRERWFPIMGTHSQRHPHEREGGAIPWSAIAPFERNAQRNHSQSLERLAERGGLSWHEAWAVMTGRQWNDPARPENSREAVLALVAEVELDIVDRLRGHVRNKVADSNVLRDMAIAADEVERIRNAEGATP